MEVGEKKWSLEAESHLEFLIQLKICERIACIEHAVGRPILEVEQDGVRFGGRGVVHEETLAVDLASAERA